jgi:hypothetical protein
MCLQARFSDADGGSILVDYNMQENYGTDLQTSHIGDGSRGSDGRYVGGDAVPSVVICRWAFLKTMDFF